MVDLPAFLEIERETQAKFNGREYDPDAVCRRPNRGTGDYFDRQWARKFELVKDICRGGRVLDLCCATGDHLVELKDEIRWGVGVDFCPALIDRASARARRAEARNVQFVVANGRALGFPDQTFDAVYCLSALYYMPRVEEVVGEISRVLVAGGQCVLDFGNRYSLNTLVCRAYPELAHPCHIPIWTMKRHLRNAGLEIVEHQAFQILPFWGNRPRWLRPLLSPFWMRALQKEVRGRMVEEWLDGLGLFRAIAFRHLFVCRKGRVRAG